MFFHGLGSLLLCKVSSTFFPFFEVNYLNGTFEVSGNGLHVVILLCLSWLELFDVPVFSMMCEE